MMNSPQVAIPAEPVGKKELLHAVYGVYTSWVERFPLACRKGCNTCCTQSVHMTSLEGEIILDFLKGAGRDYWLLEKLASIAPGKGGQAVTMNQFAGACLKHQDIRGEPGGNWDFTPCFFLEEGICSIYEARPFGCRSFGSFVQCTIDSAAHMAPIHLAVNTVFTQIIEHVNSDGGYCSSMAAILHSLVETPTLNDKIHLLPARPVPGFLLEPHEIKVVQHLLQQLQGQFPEKGIFGDLIDNFMPI
jgi:Fe-S-cluster containining protein